MKNPKTVLTTGEIARICNVAPRTVSKWFDSGQLRGYRIPGSRDRRVPVDQLIRFMRAHNIPLNGLESGAVKILVALDNADVRDLLVNVLGSEAGYEARPAATLFETGIQLAAFKPRVLLLDLDLVGPTPRDVIRAIKASPEFESCNIIAVTGPLRDADQQALRDQGFSACIAKPFEARQVVSAIETLLAPRP